MLKLWNLYLDGEQPLAFSLNTSTPYGQKIGLIGSAQNGKSALISFVQRGVHQEGTYIEASHKVLDLMLSVGASVICASLVAGIIAKPIDVLSDGISYKRMLPGVGKVTKVLFGRPRGVPTTSYTNPQCPVVEPVNHYASTQESELDWMDAQNHVACLIKP